MIGNGRKLTYLEIVAHHADIWNECNDSIRDCTKQAIHRNAYQYDGTS